MKGGDRAVEDACESVGAITQSEEQALHHTSKGYEEARQREEQMQNKSHRTGPGSSENCRLFAEDGVDVVKVRGEQKGLSTELHPGGPSTGCGIAPLVAPAPLTPPVAMCAG